MGYRTPLIGTASITHGQNLTISHGDVGRLGPVYIHGDNLFRKINDNIRHRAPLSSHLAIAFQIGKNRLAFKVREICWVHSGDETDDLKKLRGAKGRMTRFRQGWPEGRRCK